MKYFAYGSNMSVPRLKARVPSAAVHGVCELRGHTLRFHKVGMDGTAKCDAYFTGNDADRVEGVVYVLDPMKVDLLDQAEGAGRGYTRQQVEVFDEYGNRTQAFTYIATAIDSSLQPLCWYRHHVITGAKQHGLSDEYVTAIERVKVIRDADEVRLRRELAVYEGSDPG
ncbi:gamma-glutamylcyclotransferase [Aeoliella sp. ICT_H6.2]|uniref:Gamma-glutamylcyclotransferase n=1 Tax=Aeoliella straminimaris TaxID=2954799 RepID=A0A9X2FHR3_9BACT|nr:gamma-glutamylcyclotransferase [Aeoliella straminimaris]